MFTISIPNIITIIRMLLTPLFVIFLQAGWYLSALLVFAVAAISDGLDGFLARYFDQRTELGAYLDPLADKLLLTTAYVGLAVFHLIPIWLTVIVISRDVLILLGLAVFTLTQTPFEIAPTKWSKATTCMQLLTICLMLLAPMVTIAEMTTFFFYILTAGLTIISGGHYLFIGLKILHNQMDTGGE